MRDIICSDIHGQLRLLENVIEHSGYDRDKDTLICAGDMCDIGSQTPEVHELLDKEKAVKLIGNHEIAHMASIDIMPYDHSLDPEYKSYIAANIAIGYFQMAYDAQGVLVTHAGLSKKWVLTGIDGVGGEDTTMKSLHEAGNLTAETAAEALNLRLQSRVHLDQELGLIDIDGDQMWTSWEMPFWFRPYIHGIGGNPEHQGFWDGFKQVAGHTPEGSWNDKQRRHIKEQGVTLTDMYARKNFGNDGYCRYAVVEDGEVELVIVKGVDRSKP